MPCSRKLQFQSRQTTVPCILETEGRIHRSIYVEGEKLGMGTYQWLHPRLEEDRDRDFPSTNNPNQIHNERRMQTNLPNSLEGKLTLTLVIMTLPPSRLEIKLHMRTTTSPSVACMQRMTVEILEICIKLWARACTLRETHTPIGEHYNKLLKI